MIVENDKLLILPDNLNGVNVDSTPPKIDFDIYIWFVCNQLAHFRSPFYIAANF